MAHRSLFVLVVDIDIDIVINRGRIFDLLFSCQALIFFNGIFILQMPTHAYSVVVVARIDLLFLYAVEKISLAVVVVDVVVVDVVVVQVVVVVVVCIHRCQQHVVRPYIRRTYVQCYSLKLEHCAVQQLNVTLLATNQKRLHASTSYNPHLGPMYVGLTVYVRQAYHACRPHCLLKIYKLDRGKVYM